MYCEHYAMLGFFVCFDLIVNFMDTVIVLL